MRTLFHRSRIGPARFTWRDLGISDMTQSSRWMFALTSTSKRWRMETNLTNFCFSRTVITSCIHPTPHQADT